MRNLKLALTIFIVLGSLSLFVGCEKEVEEMADLQFQISNVSDQLIKKSVNLKSENVTIPIEDIPCSNHRASYVEVTIDGSIYTAGTFYIIEGGHEVLYTQTFPIHPGNHTVQDFKVFYDGGTPDLKSDDVLISATPHSGSDFAKYVNNPLTFDLTVVVDQKTPFAMEVVCYDDDFAVNFGFAYAGVTEIKVHGLNFFGDFCIKNKADYEASLYATQSNWAVLNGSYYDAPAIARIELWHKKDAGDWIHEEDFENSSDGETIKVIYDDHKQVLDSIELKLYVYVKLGHDYGYKYFMSILLKDDEKPAQTTDPNPPYGKTTYYALGGCAINPDYELPGYMTLPETATYKIVGDHSPGSMGGYVDAQLSNIEPYYEIGNGLYDSYCANHLIPITKDIEYDMDVYSSLYLEQIPAYARSEQWAKINWLINHIGLPGSENLYGNYSWSDFQGAIWLLEDTPWNGLALDGVPDMTSTMEQMAVDASSNYDGYTIPPGGWACVIFIPTGTPPGEVTPSVQTMFIRIDP